jgi:hypothetical protein
MKPLFRKLTRLPALLTPGLLLLALLPFAVLPSLQAQSANSSQAYPFHYDVSEEVTVSGAVTAVFTKAPTGMMNGSHLLLATSSGSVDVSLGAYGLIGKGALSLKLGEQVDVAGVMKSLKDKPVFMARTVTAGGRVYPIRNERGIAMSPQARERARTGTAQNGGAE